MVYEATNCFVNILLSQNVINVCKRRIRVPSYSYYKYKSLKTTPNGWCVHKSTSR